MLHSTTRLLLHSQLSYIQFTFLCHDFTSTAQQPQPLHFNPQRPASQKPPTDDFLPFAFDLSSTSLIDYSGNAHRNFDMAPSTPKYHLLLLPTEIRLMILRYALDAHAAWDFKFTTTIFSNDTETLHAIWWVKNHPEYLSTLYICKQIYLETIDV